MERKHEFNPKFHHKRVWQKASLLHDRNLHTKSRRSDWRILALYRANCARPTYLYFSYCCLHEDAGTAERDIKLWLFSKSVKSKNDWT